MIADRLQLNELCVVNATQSSLGQSCASVCSYAEYQQRRVEAIAARDSRLKFEVETLLDRSGSSGSSSDAQVLANANRVRIERPHMGLA